MDKIDQVSQNVAAVSANFHQSALYQEAYTSRSEEVGGFPGFWILCAEAGVAFTNIATSFAAWGQDFEWLYAIDKFSDRVMHEVWIGDPIPDVQMLEEFANDAIVSGITETIRLADL